MTKKQLEILDELAVKYNLSKTQAYDIAHCFFKRFAVLIGDPQIKNEQGIIEHFRLHTINVKHFGKFIPKTEKRVNTINAKILENVSKSGK